MIIILLLSTAISWTVNPSMSRPLRLEYSGALYHITLRGDRREAIYEDDLDRIAFNSVPYSRQRQSTADVNYKMYSIFSIIPKCFITIFVCVSPKRKYQKAFV